MRLSFLTLAAGTALAAPASAAAPTDPQGWRAAAAQDLNAIHDILRDNSPAMVVKRDSAHFRLWLNEGLRQARSRLPKVRDAKSYYYVVRYYVAGFRDSHIQFGPNRESGVNLRGYAWPGFVLGYRAGAYEVAFRAPDAPDAPPPGARLLGCDGKGAEALVRAHDLYDGNFRLASVRAARAVDLMMERGNPFITHPKICRFRVGGTTKTYRLRWRPLDDAHTDQIDAAISAGRRRQLGIEPWAPGRWWIEIPSMNGGQNWSRFYADVKAHLDAVRAADLVVIDVRGNGGGDSSYADRLARILWGDALVDARQPRLGPTVWRVSKLNRDNWAGFVEKVSADPDYPADDKAEFRRILALYDRALAHGDPTFRLEDDSGVRKPASGPNPMHGRVVLLTDTACNSACLDLMDEFTAMPDTVQAGTVTSADTIFMELTQVPLLPSGLAGFGFGHKAWIERPRGSNIPYTPAPRLTWTGKPGDEAGLRRWLATAALGK
ncbi:MAG TPA: S41 family peptidase [Allosphingosinicella sp.]|nr:S41 family peptidase [Allosphingosinicella sp.]